MDAPYFLNPFVATWSNASIYIINPTGFVLNWDEHIVSEF